MDRIRLIVAEEQEIFRQAYSVVLGSEPDVEVVGVVESGEEVRAMIPHVNPQVVLLGNNAPSHSFVEEVRRIRAQFPGVGLVLCSGSDDPECIRELFAGNSMATPNSGTPLGGWGYLLKQDVDTVAELIRVIHAVAEGRIVLDSAVAERLSHQPPYSADFIHERFTQREMEVLSLMSEGLKNVPIARV
ncbi:MAG: response regulator transcription factor, partial [SAR324 cluster bacterium]|nr:response regulator transcription factor [SAR324 cluster bacterium]